MNFTLESDPPEDIDEIEYSYPLYWEISNFSLDLLLKIVYINEVLGFLDLRDLIEWDIGSSDSEILKLSFKIKSKILKELFYER